MKSFKQFLSENINISGDFNGNLYINSDSSFEQKSIGEQFTADIMWQGNFYRLELNTDSGIPSKQKLTEQLQKKYPGSIVHNIYPAEEKNTNILDSKRYHPSKLEWI